MFPNSLFVLFNLSLVFNVCMVSVNVQCCLQLNFSRATGEKRCAHLEIKTRLVCPFGADVACKLSR